MKSLKFYSALFFLQAGVFFSVNAYGSGKNDPAWTGNPYDGYKDTQFIAATGSGKNSGEADKDAVAEVTRVLSQNIEAQEKLQQTASSVSEGLSSYMSSITTKSSVSDVSGLAVKDRCQAADGTYYARAVLNRSEAGMHYSLLFNQKADEIDTLVSEAAGKPASFEACSLLLKAYRTAKDNDGYMALLSVLNPAYHKEPSYGSSAAVGQLAQKAFNAVTVVMNITGDSGGRIAAVFSSVINETGIATTTAGSGKDAPYSFDCKLSLEDAGQSGDIYYVRYVVTCSLKEISSGKEILNFSANGRQGKLNRETAEQSAVRIVETKVKDAFSEKFSSLFNSDITGN